MQKISSLSVSSTRQFGLFKIWTRLLAQGLCRRFSSDRKSREIWWSVRLSSGVRDNLLSAGSISYFYGPSPKTDMGMTWLGISGYSSRCQQGFVVIWLRVINYMLNFGEIRFSMSSGRRTLNLHNFSILILVSHANTTQRVWAIPLPP